MPHYISVFRSRQAAYNFYRGIFLPLFSAIAIVDTGVLTSNSKYAMMHITEEQVEKYMATYHEKTGMPIDKHKARHELAALVSLLVLVHTHMKQHDWPDITTIENFTKSI